jgi:hypothetical protein
MKGILEKGRWLPFRYVARVQQLYSVTRIDCCNAHVKRVLPLVPVRQLGTPFTATMEMTVCIIAASTYQLTPKWEYRSESPPYVTNPNPRFRIALVHKKPIL